MIWSPLPSTTKATTPPYRLRLMRVREPLLLDNLRLFIVRWWSLIIWGYTWGFGCPTNQTRTTTNRQRVAFLARTLYYLRYNRPILPWQNEPTRCFEQYYTITRELFATPSSLSSLITSHSEPMSWISSLVTVTTPHWPDMTPRPSRFGRLILPFQYNHCHFPFPFPLAMS